LGGTVVMVSIEWHLHVIRGRLPCVAVLPIPESTRVLIPFDQERS
jgi:hypothetical protein